MAPTTAPKPEATHSLTVRRSFAAAPDRVFRAWTTPAEVKKWHSPGEVELAEIDLRVGGRHRIHMRSPDGALHKVGGAYRVVEPPRKVVYTWQWEGDPVETLVTVEFVAKDSGTEFVLTHADLPSADARQHHEQGWIALIDKFAKVV